MDEDLRALERAAQTGTTADVERYLGARIRRSPDLIPKLVRRMIRLERVIVDCRVNEDEYFSEVTDQDFFDFLERETPERSRRAGRLHVEGEWPPEADEQRGAMRGGRVSLTGGAAGPAPGTQPGSDTTIAGPDAAVFSPEVMAGLAARVAELERRIGISTAP